MRGGRVHSVPSLKAFLRRRNERPLSCIPCVPQYKSACFVEGVGAIDVGVSLVVEFPFGPTHHGRRKTLASDFFGVAVQIARGYGPGTLPSLEFPLRQSACRPRMRP